MPALFLSAYDCPLITKDQGATNRARDQQPKKAVKSSVFIKNYGGETGTTPYAFAHGRAIALSSTNDKGWHDGMSWVHRGSSSDGESFEKSPYGLHLFGREFDLLNSKILLHVLC